ncbi:MAG: cytidylate kinase-like family protein [Clostridium sp.]|nr:cytidylate kinase-like family protein [Clostridium sp.]
MSKIICIGRQYGSGGHKIAQALAEELNIPYYDKKILDDAIVKSGMNAEVLKNAEERLPNPLLHAIYYEGNSNDYYGKNANEILYMTQKELILEYAEKSGCIIVGRCADVILKENTNHAVKSIFANASMSYRIAATMKNESIDEKSAASVIRKADKRRSAYYSYHTGKDWGKASDYDFCINTATNDWKDIITLLSYIYQSM